MARPGGHAPPTAQLSVATLNFEDKVKNAPDRSRLTTILYALWALYPYKKTAAYDAEAHESGQCYTLFVTWDECFPVKYQELHAIQTMDYHRIRDLRVDQSGGRTSIAMEVLADSAPLEITITSITVERIVETLGVSKVQYIDREIEQGEMKKRKKGSG